MELDSGADSVSSTPRAAHPKFGGGEDRSVVRLMCSFGGKILPRPHDNQLRYVGGDTRIVAVHRNTTYASLISKLSKLLNSAGDFTVKYQLPNEDLDALITVSTDEDVDNMMEEFERLISQQINNSNNNSNNNNNNNDNNNNNSNSNRVPRLRLFLFPFTGIEESDTSRTSSIASLLDGSRKRENWFLDALNGGASAGAGAPSLERGRSEASSIVSEVPDYLFGLDNSDDTVTKLKNRAGLGDGMSGSAPGSPAFGSTSSASQMPNLPPVKTKLENPNPVPVEEVIDPQTHQTGGYAVTSGGQVWGHGSNPGSPYPVHHAPVQNFPPVYYVQAGPGQGLIQHRNSNLQPVPVPIQGHFVQQYGPGQGQGQSQGQIQVPVGYEGSGTVYGPGPVRTVGGVDPYEMQMQGNNMVQGQGPSGLSQPMYYGVNNTGMVASYPGMVVSQAGEEIRGPGPDLTMGRTLQL